MELEQQLTELQNQLSTLIEKQTELENKINAGGGAGSGGAPEKTPAEIMKTYLAENGFKGEKKNG